MFKKFCIKLFKILSDEQKAIIAAEHKMIEDLASKMSNEDFIKEYDFQKKCDSTCPKCGKSNVVDKISRVQGDGSVSGSFILGSGSIYGSSHIDTEAVNRCNNCNHEWKKYKLNHTSSHKFKVKWMNDIAEYDEDPTSNWCKKGVDLIKDFHLETIEEIFEEVYDDCYYSTRNNLTTGIMKKYFKSIWDENKVK